MSIKRYLCSVKVHIEVATPYVDEGGNQLWKTHKIGLPAFHPGRYEFAHAYLLAKTVRGITPPGTAYQGCYQTNIYFIGEESDSGGE